MIKFFKIKRTRLVLLIIALILINSALLSFLRPSQGKKESISGGIKYRNNNLPNVLNLEQLSIFEPDQAKINQFNQKVDKVYKRQQLDTDRKLDKKKNKKTKSKYDKKSYNVVISDVSIFSKYNYFDPKFTFSVLLQYINDNITKESHNAAKLRQIDFPYFNWNDYVDLSELNKYRYSHDKLSCLEFDQSTDNKNQDINAFIKKWDRYCIDDNEIEDELENNQELDDDIRNKFRYIQSQKELSTGFHMYKPPGRQSLFNRNIIGKSYIQDFMHSASSISMLLPEDHFVKVNINVNDKFKKTRLIDSKLIEGKMTKTRNKKPEWNLRVELDTLVKKLSQFDKKRQKPSEIVPSLPYQVELPMSEFKNNLHDLPSSLQLTHSFQTSLTISHQTSRQWRHFEEAYISESQKNHAKGGHLDWRFFNQNMLYDKQLRKIGQYNLIKTWLKFINRVGFKSWLAHGTLLSWHFNGKSFPWDLDVDVQMSLEDFIKLSNQFNQTIIVDFGNGQQQNAPIRHGRYLLDCGTFITRRHVENSANNIDARLIDLDTGLYIDITALSESNREGGNSDEVNCRNEHYYNVSDLNPLRLSLFEGELTYIPYNYSKILIEEYKYQSMLKMNFRGHKFHHNLWIEEGDDALDFDKLLEANVEEYYKSSKLINFHVYETFHPNVDKLHDKYGVLDKSLTTEYLFDDYYNHNQMRDINVELGVIHQEISKVSAAELKSVQHLVSIKQGLQIEDDK